MGKYHVVTVNGKSAIFDENENCVSYWWSDVIATGLIKGKTEYYLVQDDKKGYAIFRINDPDKPVSGWWRYISTDGLINGDTEYYIASESIIDYTGDKPTLRTREAIFHINNPDESASQWWDKIYAKECLKGDSDYYRVSKGGLMAIFFIGDPYQPKSQWYKYIDNEGAVEGNTSYYLAENQEGQKAIFSLDSPHEPITQWWSKIYCSSFLQGKSPYYLAVDAQTGKQAIFHIDNPYQPVSQWWKEITANTFLEHGPYYSVLNDNKEEAIFHVDNPDTPVSKWWRYIDEQGLLWGETSLYIAFDQNKKCAIFHKDNPEQPLSQWWDEIDASMLLSNKSGYYIAKNKDNKKAIFHINNADEKISKWYFELYAKELLKGNTEYYIARHNFQYRVFHKDDRDDPIRSFAQVYGLGIFHEHSPYFVVVDSTSGKPLVFHISDPIYPLYEIPLAGVRHILFADEQYAVLIKDSQLMIYQLFSDNLKVLTKASTYIEQMFAEESNRISIFSTEPLIRQYIQYDLIPIKTLKQYYLFDTKGHLIDIFSQLADMKKYILDNIITKNASDNPDILVLY